MPEGEAAKMAASRLTMKNDNYGGDATSAIPKRKLTFKKASSSTLLRVTYADIMRVYGAGKVCYWWIKIDGKNCAVPLYNAKHSSSTSDNDHLPHAIVGTCTGIKAGTHTMTIALTNNGGADCYTGWSPSSARDAFFLEAEELNPKGQITTVIRRISADGRDGGWINGGFFVLQPDVINWIEGDKTSFEADVLPRLAAAGELTAYKHQGFWQPMDTLREKNLLNELWNAGKAPWKIWE